jgi:hypothetical protein
MAERCYGQLRHLPSDSFCWTNHDCHTFNSVGTLAIRRFLRPDYYQDLPDSLLPEPIKQDNPLGIWWRVDGRLTLT